MIDFNNKVLFKLKPCDDDRFAKIISPMLLDDERVISAFSAVRDGVVFTNYRVMSINVQGVTGKKVDITSMPYKKIQAFSVETAGVIDLDAEMDLWFSGMGRVRFEFSGNCNIKQLANIIGGYTIR